MLAPVRTALSGRVMPEAYSQTFSGGLRKDQQLSEGGLSRPPANREQQVPIWP